MSKACDDFRELFELIDRFPKRYRSKVIDIIVRTIDEFISAHDKSV